MSVDGEPWAHVEAPSSSTADGVSAATTNVPYTLTADGRYVSPDGRFCWSGTSWVPLAPPATGEPGYGAPGYGPLGYAAPGAASPYTQPWPAPSTQTGPASFAIASLVLGIVWLFGIGSVLAVIFGHIALNRIKRGEASGQGRAIAGLVLGYIGIVLVVLAAIGFAVSPSQEAAGSQGTPSTRAANEQALSLVKRTAIAEEEYDVDNAAYTSNPHDLDSYGFYSDQLVSIVVHVTNDDYCLIGSNTQVTRGRVWYTYMNGDIGTYSSKILAEQACGATNPDGYGVLSGDGS